MNKKVLIQITLLIVIGLILLKIFSLYQEKKNKNQIKNKNDEKILNENFENIDSNIIENIKYVAKDDRDNIYEIESQFGKINPEKPDIILMDKVTAIIYLKNREEIIISSDHAIYNSKSYETNFYTNVKLSYIEHYITSKNIYLSFENNLVSISNNVIYKNLNNEMKADEIEMNLITKEIKIFMHDNEKKIQILSKK
tara:strand:+ start:721 stop:1311 length:591 start_codon:yes stop_codon:yes gene_type:complete